MNITKPLKNQRSAFGRSAGLDMVFCVLAGILGTFWVLDGASIEPISFHAGRAGLVGFASAFFFFAATMAFGLFAATRIVIRDKIKKEALAAFLWPSDGLSVLAQPITFGAAQCHPDGLRRPPRAL